MAVAETVVVIIITKTIRIRIIIPTIIIIIQRRIIIIKLVTYIDCIEDTQMLKMNYTK